MMIHDVDLDTIQINQNNKIATWFPCFFNSIPHYIS